VFAVFGSELDLGSLIVAAGAYVSGGEIALQKLSKSLNGEGKAAVAVMHCFKRNVLA
jgi:hypothetical protein